MDKELEYKLQEDFPFFFKDMWGDKKTTGMAWGITCGNGWYELIREAVTGISKENDTLPLEYRCYASRIKEKLGTLRLYVHIPEMMTLYSENLIRNLIDIAERKSSITCEVCGSLAGELTGYAKLNREGIKVPGGYVRTLCKPHRTRDRVVIKLDEQGARFA